MLRDYTADNEAIVAVAHAVAARANSGTTEFIREAVIKGSWETLLTEGKNLPLHDPTPEDLTLFFDEQRRLVREYLGETPEAYQLISALEYAQHNTGSYLKPHVFYTWQHVANLADYTLSRNTAERKLIIAIDLDGCLYDFMGTMREWLIARGWDPTGLTEPTEYYVQREWGIDEKVFHDEMVSSLHENVMFRKGDAFLDATEGARLLGQNGHILLANSARLFAGVEEKSRAATLQWLREQNVHVDRIHLADPVDPQDKLSAAFDLLIDDHPGNVEAALKSGRSAVLLDRPWNKGYAELPRASYEEISKDPFAFLVK